MKTRNFLLLLIFVLISAVLTFTACKKTDTDDDDTTLASDNSIIQSTFDQTQSMADQAANGALQTFIANGDVNLLSSCATITHDTVSTPRVLTIDFGSTNCLCNDGRYRRGSISVSYTGKYRDSGTVITFTFNNYAVNDHVVSNTSTKVVTNKGSKTNGHPWFTIYESGSITKPNNGGTITWLSNREREWIAGYNTKWWWADDEYLISGTASGITASAVSYTMTITTPLQIMLNCHNIVSGIVDITPTGKYTYTLNYGNGTCDNQATVLYRGKTYNVTLR
jgi:hypothetical protein